MGQPGFRARLEITTDSGAAGVSDRGLRRGVNADAVALTMVDTWTVGVVCDGVSMSPRAERAAQVAAETGLAAVAEALRRGAIPEDALIDGTLRASRAVSALAASVHAAPACTYVSGICGPVGIWVAGVGDSRAYWLPDDGPGMVLTEDDTAADEVLAAWLGADADEPTPRIRSYRPRGTGQLLLCTDGLWRYLPTVESLPANRRGADSLANARALVGHALAAGGHDNVSALLYLSGKRRAGPLESYTPRVPISAWDEVSAAVAAAPYPVSILTTDSRRGAECLAGLGMTINSWLGAVVVNTGGLVVDHGWLRILGSGADPLPDILEGTGPGRLPVAYDVLGGQFVWAPGESGRPTIHYFGPDDLQWVDLDQGYGDWLHAMLGGSLDRFYEGLRWPGWPEEVAAVPLDQGIHTYPPPWSTEGKDLSTVSRKAIGLAELVAAHQNAAQR